MGAVSDHAQNLGVGLPQPGAARQPVRARSRWAGWLEALGVALSPLVAVLVLRLRLMAPSTLNDPAISTGFVIGPRDMFTRYAAAFAATAKMRQAASVGFLVPARLDYLAFGAVPGFFVTRYVFALVAVGPVYLLLRRLYGPAAGVAGIVVVLSSPVIVTAWGTDYPVCAVVSYMAGALACLAMPCSPRRRRAWLAAAGVLLVLAVWSHGSAVPLAGATLAAYLGVRLVRERAGLPGDLALLAAVAAAVTGLLVAASAVVMGHANFIALTWQAFRYLSQPSQTAQWHSASWRWAPYVAYLLVPPAVLGAFAVAVVRRGRLVPTPVILVGVAAAAQLVVYAWLQFFGTVQTLEQYFFSSVLWAGTSLMLAITIAELARPLWHRPVARWLPAAVLLIVPLGYEFGPRVPAFGWVPFGAVLVGAVVAAAVAARGSARFHSRLTAPAATGLALAALAGATLVLAVAPIPHHRQLPGTLPAGIDPVPPYASALGGSGAAYIDGYRIATALPGLVGPAAYPGEQVFSWRLTNDPAGYVMHAAGIYRGGLGRPAGSSPNLTAHDRHKLESRRPAELLLLGSSPASFPRALRELAGFRPALVRTGKIRAGPLVLHVWLIRLGIYYHPPAR